MIFNVPYPPDFYGIESHFFLIKGQYNKLILEQLMKGHTPDSTRPVHEGITIVSKEKV
jgi:hypothetical protein